jgi:hypothetical protein
MVVWEAFGKFGEQLGDGFLMVSNFKLLQSAL